MDALRSLYYETHIFPTDTDYYRQINNHCLVYLVLYWINKETLYPAFLEEEMDLESIGLMQEADLIYFQLDNDVLFRHFVGWLNL
jgi:hypothetical protein